jgi:hypothetical protein
MLVGRYTFLVLTSAILTGHAAHSTLAQQASTAPAAMACILLSDVLARQACWRADASFDCKTLLDTREAADCTIYHLNQASRASTELGNLGGFVLPVPPAASPPT